MNEEKKKYALVKEPFELVRSSTSEKIVPGYYEFLYLTLSLMAERYKNKGDMTNLRYLVNAGEIASELRLEDNKSAYRKLRVDAKRVFKNQNMLHITYHIGDAVCEKDFNVYGALDYLPKGVIQIELTQSFAELTIPWIERKELSTYFSRFEVLPMKSEYSMAIFPDLIRDLRLFELKAKGKLQGESFTSIYKYDDFKEKLKIPESYSTGNIKKLCDNIVKDVNEYTHYHTEVFYNYVYGGGTPKKLTHICFRTIDKTVKTVSTAEKNDSVENSNLTPTKYDIGWLVCMSNGKIEEKTAKKIYTYALKYNRDRDYIERCYKISNKPTTENLCGMMISLLKDGINEPIHGDNTSNSDKQNDFLMSIINGTRTLDTSDTIVTEENE